MRAHRAGAGIRHRSLLALLILTWAVSWPVVKIGITTTPPIWYACARYVIGAACLFAFVAVRRELAFPPPSDRLLVAVSGALQMAAYSALTGLALTRLPPGRASVLAFSTPIWVIPLARWRLHEPISRRAACGVAVGLLGLLIIAAPSVHLGGVGEIRAFIMLVSAAAAWAVSLVVVRGHRFRATPLALAPWQMLLAAGLLLPAALLAEGWPPAIAGRGAASLAYVGPIATAFAYWAVVESGRRFPASTMSMGLLLTPGLGILISAVALGEAVGASLVAGAALTAVGIRLATSGTSDRRNDISDPPSLATGPRTLVTPCRPRTSASEPSSDPFGTCLALKADEGRAPRPTRPGQRRAVDKE